MTVLDRINVRLDPSERATVSRYASANDLSLSQACRALIVNTRTLSPSLTPEAYQRAVEVAARTVPGLPRTQLEAIVSSVIVSLHKA